MARSVSRRRGAPLSLLLELASLTFAVAAFVVLAFVPLGTYVEAQELSMDPSGRVVETGGGERIVGRVTLVEHDGPGVLAVFAVPVVVAALPLAFPSRRRRAARVTAATLLGAFVVLGVASIGIFYGPAAVLMAMAAARSGDSG